MYVTDMMHFAGVDELVGAKFNGAKRFAAYLGGVVGVATANAPSKVIESALPCHRRPGHQACPGKLLVRRSEAPRQINWACPSCGEEGVISNFEQSIWDVSPPLEIAGEERAAFLSPDQYKKLLALVVLDEDARRVLYAARLIGRGVLVMAGEDDFEHLIESLGSLSLVKSLGPPFLMQSEECRPPPEASRWPRSAPRCPGAAAPSRSDRGCLPLELVEPHVHLGDDAAPLPPAGQNFRCRQTSEQQSAGRRDAT